ncbi:MAG: hypothetical protein AB8H86_19025 [Polyangiales bacterium]
MRLLGTFARVWWLALLLPLGGCLQQGCPCGASPEDPFAEHDLAFAGTHFLDGECACRCGAGGDRFAMPKDTACEDIQAACVDGEGREARLECE